MEQSNSPALRKDRTLYQDRSGSYCIHSNSPIATTNEDRFYRLFRLCFRIERIDDARPVRVERDDVPRREFDNCRLDANTDFMGDGEYTLRSVEMHDEAKHVISRNW